MEFKNSESVSADWKSDKSSLKHLVKSYIFCTKIKPNIKKNPSKCQHSAFLKLSPKKQNRDTLLTLEYNIGRDIRCSKTAEKQDWFSGMQEKNDKSSSYLRVYLHDDTILTKCA